MKTQSIHHHLLQLLLFLSLFKFIFSSKWNNNIKLNQICLNLFSQSKKQLTRFKQEDSIIIWLGKPSLSLHIEGKYGPLPLPTIWKSFVNILYINKCIIKENYKENYKDSYIKQITLFILEWLNENNEYKDRNIYLAGNEEDKTGGYYLLSVAKHWLSLYSNQINLKGILLGNPLHPPIISRHFGHRSFETINNMTYWSIDRAKQNIFCNSRYSQVDFVMNDCQFHYTTTNSNDNVNDNVNDNDIKKSINGMYEYKLSSISTYDKCYADPIKFESDWSISKSLPYDNVYPTLSYSNSKSPVYPKCLPKLTKEQDEAYDTLNILLSSSLSIVMYTSIYKSSQAICSFYIGMYNADGLYYRLDDTVSSSYPNASYRIQMFNQASLIPYESAWTSSSTQSYSIPKGMIQDGNDIIEVIENNDNDSNNDNGIVWIQLDSRYAPTMGQLSNGKKVEYEELLNRVTAVNILSHLIGKHDKPSSSSNSNSKIKDYGPILDYTDLFV